MAFVKVETASGMRSTYTLVKIGPKSPKSDLCVYIYQAGGDIYTLTKYVDDVILLGKDVTVLEKIKHKLMGCSSMSDMGDISLVLRMEVVRDRNGKEVSISRKNYTKSLLE